ncbi:MAG: recombination protein RecR [Ruminococcaceae bacterium]|nr:recombination protein RecR [Oscillospiraceae bacterium]
MFNFIEPVEKLIEQFRRLPGVGYKSAVRMAFAVVDMDKEKAESFATAILDAKEKITVCSICKNISDSDICPICASESRNKSVICVVEDVKDILAIEKAQEFRGVYHVLGGLISPTDGVGPEKLNIKELLARINEEVKEIIVATTPSVEGEATALYLSRLIKPLGVSVSRLAYGIPAGAELEYADEMTITRALEGRLTL